MKITRKKLNSIIESFFQEETINEDTTSPQGSTAQVARQISEKNSKIHEIRLYDNKIEFYVSHPDPTVSAPYKVSDDGTTERVEQRYEFQILAAPLLDEKSGIKIRNYIQSYPIISTSVGGGESYSGTPDSKGNIKNVPLDRDSETGRASGVKTFTHDNIEWTLEDYDGSRMDRFKASFRPGSVRYKNYDQWDGIYIYFDDSMGGSILLTASRAEDFYQDVLSRIDDETAALADMGLPADHKFELNVSKVDVKASDPKIMQYDFATLMSKLQEYQSRGDEEISSPQHAVINSAMVSIVKPTAFLPPQRTYMLEIDPPESGDDVKYTLFYIFSAHDIKVTRSMSKVRMSKGDLSGNWMPGAIHTKVTLNIEVTKRWTPVAQET
tara:strand:- start:117 stop:1262 length:1146 start_codon:yes stop_codon:yes gene_type:complete